MTIRIDEHAMHKALAETEQRMWDAALDYHVGLNAWRRGRHPLRKPVSKYPAVAEAMSLLVDAVGDVWDDGLNPISTLDDDKEPLK